MKSTSIKIDALKLGKNPSKDSSGVNLIHEVYVREAIKTRLADSKAGRTKTVSAVRKKVRTCRMNVHWTQIAIDHLEGIHDDIALNSTFFCV